MDTRSIDHHFRGLSAVGVSGRFLAGPERFRDVGLGMGVHESIIPAAVATMVPNIVGLGLRIYTAGYGVFWFIGSVIIGRLYDVSIYTS